MTKEPVDLAQLADTLEALRQEVVRLNERVARLEAADKGQVPGVRSPESGIRGPESASSLTPDKAVLSEELILVISAAIAAFLGKKPHIRQIRLLGSVAWAQEGRVTIQASHALSVHHS
jgi:methylmalonyl-CoA carboxyltransferase large subunit